MAGAVFVIVLFIAPRQGLISRWARSRRQRLQFAGEALLVHLSHHENDPDAADEFLVDHLARHLQWDPRFGNRVVRYVTGRGFATREQDAMQQRLWLTDKGRSLAQEVMLR